MLTVLRGKCVIIPQKQKLHSRLQDLHVGHVGVCTMKAFARSSIWWPRLDKAIEETAAQCEPSTPSIATSECPMRNDYNEWNNHHFFVLVDAFTKWPEVKAVSCTISKTIINILRDTFSTYGFPQILVSDNGPQFISTEFQNFCCENHIIDHKLPPYHPIINNLAENMVKSVKTHLKKHMIMSVGLLMSTDFLMTYHNIGHTSYNRNSTNTSSVCLDTLYSFVNNLQLHNQHQTQARRQGSSLRLPSHIHLKMAAWNNYCDMW